MSAVLGPGQVRGRFGDGASNRSSSIPRHDPQDTRGGNRDGCRRGTTGTPAQQLTRPYRWREDHAGWTPALSERHRTANLSDHHGRKEHLAGNVRAAMHSGTWRNPNGTPSSQAVCPAPSGVAHKAVARTAATTWYLRAGRTRSSPASQKRQPEQGRRDQSQCQNQIPPEPTTRHRVTSVFAIIAVVSSLCRHLPSAPAGRSKPITPPWSQAVESQEFHRFSFPSGLGCLLIDSIPKQPCLSGIIPHAGSGHGNNHLIYQKGGGGQSPADCFIDQEGWVSKGGGESRTKNRRQCLRRIPHPALLHGGDPCCAHART